MSFRKMACKHLAQYKTEVLRVQEDGVFNYKGRDLSVAHILPIVHLKKNILERYRTQFWKSDDAKIKLHRFFHHLNSSQALCINLFYPMIAENKLGLFPRYLGIAPEVVLDALFEKESDIEQADRNTSFDFYIQVAGANKIFVEVKYTENGFAKAKNDEEHLTKFRNTYLPIVMGKSSFLVSGCQDELLFLTHYQILRNLVHISDTDHVVFLFPSANTVVKKQAIDAKERLLTDAGRTHCSIVFLDEFVSFLEDRCAGSPLDGYYQAFRAKYLPQ